MAVVVTGGYGHCGAWIVKQLAEAGKEVIIFNRTHRRIDFLEGFGEKISFFKGDIQDLPSIFRLFKEHHTRIEGIIHIAGLMGGPYFASNPHLHININTMGTVNFLEAARIYDIKKFIFISSGSVYGERSDIPKETDPVSPSDLYGAVKASSEFLGLQYANQFGIDFKAVRIFFAYGPGRLPSELYPLYQAIFGGLEGIKEMKLEAGREQEIDFTFIGDVAKAVVMLYNADVTKHRIYNVASGSSYKLPEVVKIANRYAASPINTEFGPGKIIPRGPSLDIGRISEEFGFKADYSIEEGIKSYAEWINSNKKWGNI